MSDNGVAPAGSRQRPVFPDDVSRDSAVPGYVDPLDVPQPGAGPILAVKRFYLLFASFHGRASRSEYWWVVLFLALAFTLLGILGFAGGAATGRTASGQLQLGVGVSPFVFVAGALTLASILPWIALTVRRLHDLDLTGLLALLLLVPTVGSLALLVLCARGSNPGGARFDRIRPIYPSDFHPEGFVPPAAVGPSAHTQLGQNFGPH